MLFLKWAWQQYVHLAQLEKINTHGENTLIEPPTDIHIANPFLGWAPAVVIDLVLAKAAARWAQHEEGSNEEVGFTRRMIWLHILGLIDGRIFFPIWAIW